LVRIARKNTMNIKATCSDGVDPCPEDTAELIGLDDDFRDRIYTNTIEKLMAESGGSPVWLCDVVQRMLDDGYNQGFELAKKEFAGWAFEAHASYRVTLRSYGIVDAMWTAQVLASEVRSPSGAVYHTITRP
jgi:hypothetical protein